MTASGVTSAAFICVNQCSAFCTLPSFAKASMTVLKDTMHGRKPSAIIRWIHSSALVASRDRAHALIMVLYVIPLGCWPARSILPHQTVASSMSPTFAQAPIIELKVTLLGRTPACSIFAAHHSAARGFPALVHSWISPWKRVLLPAPRQACTVVSSCLCACSMLPASRYLTTSFRWGSCSEALSAREDARAVAGWSEEASELGCEPVAEHPAMQPYGIPCVLASCLDLAATMAGIV
mmetsp:Transcript_32592/g.103367  ORF Transcript_32592/g.103367 Transcript_32592/m.103367 type:complete len:237 (+) Transcript_32592:771-1481(+)